MILRHYQQTAVDKIYDYLREKSGNPCVVLPTGSGKTPLLATLCRDAVQNWDGRVLVLAHVKELLEQSVEKIKAVAPDLDVGVYSAGLKRKEAANAVVVAGIQSAYKRGAELGRFDLAIIDECFPAGTPILTPDGTKCVDALNIGDTVLNAYGHGRVLAVSVRESSDMFRLEFSNGSSVECTGNHLFFTCSGWKKASELMAGEISFGVEAVSVLQKNILPKTMDFSAGEGDCCSSETVEQARLLLSILRQEAEEPDEQLSVTIEDEGKTTRNSAQADSSGRQRMSASSSSISDAACPRGGMGIGIPCVSGHGERQRVSDLLQDRHCEPEQDDRNRTGREFSRIAFAEISGYQENGDAEVVRVVSVSRIEREGTTTVFNLHVSGHPSYFANGRLVHNCHLISEKSEGTYQQLLSDLMEINPDLRIIGLTATPYRTGDGDLCGKDKLLTEIAYEVGVKQLINEGFLSRIVNKHAVGSIDTSAIKIVRGEFDDRQAEAAFIEGSIVRNACEEILGWTAKRKSVLIFCQTIDHARMVVNHLEIALADVESIFGDTPDDERADILKRFKTGKLQYLVNVNVLTTGFDAPNVDAVVLLRATVSPGLYYQMVGRGFRLAEGKENCLLLDFGGNVRRHGPVDVIRAKAKGKSEGPSTRVCHECREVLPISCAICTECGFEFPKQDREITHDPFADDAEPVSTDPVSETVPVDKVFYNVHTKKGADEGTPQTLRVTYQLSMFSRVSEWVCVEHQGFARKKAEKWWALRSHDECPHSAAQAVQMAEDGRLLAPTSITIKTTPGKAFPEIVGYDLPDLDTFDSPNAVGEFDALELEAMALMDTLNTRLTLVPAEEEDCPF